MREAWAGAFGAADYPNVMAKVFLRHGKIGGREAFMLGQLYPPTVAVIAADEVMAMHKIVGSAGHGEIDVCAEDEEREAWELIAWARGDKPSLPINSEWRPVSEQWGDAV
jgi:hypothetical protein